MIAGANLPPLVQAFFTDRLMAQRQASPHTMGEGVSSRIVTSGHVRYDVGYGQAATNRVFRCPLPRHLSR